MPASAARSSPGAEGLRATLSDVAKLAGVSLASASLALRGKPGVGESTRRRILQVAKELDYRSPAATEWVSGSIGLLVKSSPDDAAETNQFYGPVIAGISEACRAAGIEIRLDVLPVDEHFNPIGAPRLVAAAGIRGLLVLGAYLSEGSAQLLARRPVVLVDGYAAGPGSFASVVSDNVGGTASATARLIELGHRRIALVGTAPDAFPSIRERRSGYTQAMLAAGLEPYYVDGPHHHPERCAEAALTTVDAREPPTGFVAANDDVAIELLRHLRDRVPREVSVVGFDDIDAAGKVRPRLDTVAINKQAMGRLAVSLLRHCITYPADPVFTVTQRAALVIRESAAPPPGPVLG